MWEYIVRELPAHLDESAKEMGALVRRKGVRSAADLLRVILTYGVTDLSLKAVAAWASSIGLAQLSSIALFYRVRDAEEWLAHLISALLQRDVTPVASPRLPISLVNATGVTGPGPKARRATGRGSGRTLALRPSWGGRARVASRPSTPEGRA